MTSSFPGTRAVIVFGVPPGEQRWFPDQRGITVVLADDGLIGKLRAGIPGSAGLVLCTGELSNGQVSTLRRKAQVNRALFYGPSDAADLGRMAHRFLGLRVPPCRTEDQEKDMLNELFVEASREAELLKRQIAEYDPEALDRLRNERDELELKVASLGTDVERVREELSGSSGEAQRLARVLAEARSQGAEASARVERIRIEMEEIRATADKAVKKAQSRSTEDWREALAALAREPGLKSILATRETDLSEVRQEVASLREQAQVDIRRIRALEIEVENGREAQRRLAALDKIIGTESGSRGRTKRRK